ncbi:MAG: hypothetical protein AB7V62_13740 [Thermoleophilia bacterium]
MTVLTPSAAIRGTLAPSVTFVTIPAPGGRGSWAPLSLEDAELTPLVPAGAPSRRIGAFEAHGEGIVALLVDEPDAPAVDSWTDYKDGVEGAFHLGPFTVTGVMRRLNPQVMETVMPVDGARFAWAATGEPLDLFTAPLALVGIRWLSGWEPAGS